MSDEEARQELYRLLHDNVPGHQAIARVLEVGSSYLDIAHGHITDIDRDGDRWDVIGSTDPPEGPYPVGLTANLSDSYCRRTFQQSGPVALHEASDQGWAEDHAYRQHQLETYLGIRIEAFGEPYGTICFVEQDPRAAPFTEAELYFMELASHVLRNVLEQSHSERDLANRDRLISVLNRVLRHNLRNDLNIVQAYAQMIEDQSGEDEARWAAKINSRTTKLLAIAEKSRKLDRLTKSVPIARPIDVVPIVTAAVSDVRAGFGSAAISVTAPDEARAFAAPQLEAAVAELLTNAATHAGANPTIEVAVQAGGEQTTISIVDDGPGLPTIERRILTGANETALEHGSGLGLAFVYWIVANLGGSIDVESSPSGTALSIHLQGAA